MSRLRYHPKGMVNWVREQMSRGDRRGTVLSFCWRRSDCSAWRNTTDKSLYHKGLTKSLLVPEIVQRP